MKGDERESGVSYPGVLLDTASASVSPDESPGGSCSHWTVTNYSDCVATRSGARPVHTTCGHPSRHLPADVTLAACRAACAADKTCSTIQWQGAAAQVREAPPSPRLFFSVTSCETIIPKTGSGQIQRKTVRNIFK
jgi:hypothetical protein